MRKLSVAQCMNGIYIQQEDGSIKELHDWDWITNDIEAWLLKDKPIKDYFMMYITESIYPNEWLADCIRNAYPQHLETLEHLLVLV